MSRHPREIPSLPEGTRRAARAAFPRGHADMRLPDVLGAIYDTSLFAPLCPARGQPAGLPGG